MQNKAGASKSLGTSHWVSPSLDICKIQNAPNRILVTQFAILFPGRSTAQRGGGEGEGAVIPVDSLHFKASPLSSGRGVVRRMY
jgi:hypothetical protein